MMLSREEIRETRTLGLIEIEPFDEEMLQPASYDLKVGKDAATIPKNGEPRIDLEKERILVIPAYAPAIIWAKEHIRLPLDLAGRFGLKSHLSRRGIYASVGPQVDPGFEGKLSVTLFNFTPLSVAINYEDPFLSLELHRLSSPTKEGYTGEYQRRDTFTAKEIEQVMGYKGHGLSEVVRGFEEVRQAIHKVATLSEKFDSFLENYTQQNKDSAEFNRALLTEMKKLVEHIAVERPRNVVLRAISRKQAKDEIVQLFREAKRTLFYSDVAEQLNLDLELVVELCNELEKEGAIGVLEQHETKGPERKRE